MGALLNPILCKSRPRTNPTLMNWEHYWIPPYGREDYWYESHPMEVGSLLNPSLWKWEHYWNPSQWKWDYYWIPSYGSGITIEIPAYGSGSTIESHPMEVVALLNRTLMKWEHYWIPPYGSGSTIESTLWKWGPLIWIPPVEARSADESQRHLGGPGEVVMWEHHSSGKMKNI